MKRSEIFIEIMRTNHGWKICADNPKFSMIDRTGVPDAELGIVLEGITSYIYDELDSVCNFYIV